MQDVANDMDDLFQRAADDYPLDTGKGDWDTVLSKITEDAETPVAVAATANKGKGKFIAGALLLGCLFTGLFINDGTLNKHGSGKKTLPINQSAIVVTNDIKDDVQTETIIHKTTIQKNSGPIYRTSQLTTEKNNTTELTVAGIDKTDVQVATIDYDNKEPFYRKLIAGSIIPDYSYHLLMKNHKAVSINIDDSKTKYIARQEPITNAISNKKKDADNNIKGIYAGLVGGPEFSKGSDMAFNNSGLSAGVLLGYRFNKKISLESGLIWNNKKYTSQGKHFNMKKVAATMPAGMIINNLSSNISLLEIPLKIKYDVYNKHNTVLFFTGGVSSYIMTKEENHYNVSLNGNDQQMTGVYKKNSYEFPAVVNLSVGYQKNVSKNFDIRLEPFLKIPLQGIGVGNLPVTSAGLQLGIIHRLK